MLNQPTFTFPSGHVAFSLPEDHGDLPVLNDSYLVEVETYDWNNSNGDTFGEDDSELLVWVSDTHVPVEGGKVDPQTFARAVRECLDKSGYHGYFVEEVVPSITRYGITLRAVIGS